MELASISTIDRGDRVRAGRRRSGFARGGQCAQQTHTGILDVESEQTEVTVPIIDAREGFSSVYAMREHEGCVILSSWKRSRKSFTASRTPIAPMRSTTRI